MRSLEQLVEPPMRSRPADARKQAHLLRGRQRSEVRRDTSPTRPVAPGERRDPVVDHAPGFPTVVIAVDGQPDSVTALDWARDHLIGPYHRVVAVTAYVLPIIAPDIQSWLVPSMKYFSAAAMLPKRVGLPRASPAQSRRSSLVA